MNTTKYLQTDSRWSGLGYPKKPCTIGNSGCGEVALCNAIIEMEQYAKYTPKTIQPYCKQYAASNCGGTFWSGIPKMMKNYGLTEVKEHATMDSLWKELAKGNRVAIYLMGSRKGGSKKVHWTSSGHFVCSVDYKYDGKHWVYMKDSYSNSALRNGWISYEGNIKGDCLKVWSGKLNGAKPSPQPIPTPAPTPSGKLTVDGICGKATVKRMQEFFGCKVKDGIISGQYKKYKSLYPSITAIQYGKGGSNCIYKLQQWLGLSNPDGIIGKNTTKAWQKKLRSLGYLAKNETIDGIFGVKSMRAWQECLNNDGKAKSNPRPAPTPTPTPTPPTPTPTPTPKADKYKVIDVSEWQGTIDWAKVKADGVVGAIIRYADGDYLDPKFDVNMKSAKMYGLHIGAYIFSRAKTKAQAEKEAERLFNACKPYAPDLPLYIDLEDSKLSKYAEIVAQAFINKIKALGGKPGVYANLNWWRNYLTKTAKLSFAMWLAQYNDTMDYKPKSYVGMWQYSSKGKVKGISGNVDMDWLYIPYWEDAKKEEPAPTPEPQPTPQPAPAKTIDELAHEVLDGKWGSGEERKKRLTEAGYDYDAVQKRVNEIIEASKTIIDKEMDACEVQAEWMKNYKYEWESHPTIEKSKKKGTCVTYVACVLQRIGILKSGQYIWHNGKGYGTGKVYGTNSKMTTTYMDNKTFTACRNELKKGDIVLVDDNKSGEAGNGGHIMIFAGKWSKNGNPYVWDNHSAERIKSGKKGVRTYGNDRKILAIVRLK